MGLLGQLHEIYIFSVAPQPIWDLGHLIVEVSGSHTIKHSHIQTHTHAHTYALYDSTERVISSSQRPLRTKHTADIRDEQP